MLQINVADNTYLWPGVWKLNLLYNLAKTINQAMFKVLIYKTVVCMNHVEMKRHRRLGTQFVVKHIIPSIYITCT